MLTAQTLTRRRATYLPFSPPLIGEEEIQEVVDTLRSLWITTGPKTRRFEREFAQCFNAQGTLALSSCTAGLHTALVALSVGPGDEVITTPLTFAATINVIEHVGARPVLVDVEADTLNIDPALIEAAITPRTRVLLPVHYAGHPADMDAIRSLADLHGLAILEDAAHAVAARYRGCWIGSGPNPVAFSFYATKNLTTGEGGMLTGDAEFLERARVISLHGMSVNAWNRYGKGGSWFYDVVLPGFKYNMTDLQASMGLCQLRKLPAAQARRAEIVALYQQAFAGQDALILPVARPEVDHAWHLFVLRLRPETLRIGRDRFIQELAERNIGTSVHFIPMHLHGYMRQKYGYRPTDFPIAFDNYLGMLSLPLSPRMTDEDAYDVIEAVLDILGAHLR